MATLTPSTPMHDIGRGKEPPPPPPGGGDDARGGEIPDYGARLRRARVALTCGIVMVTMLFLALTGAYLVREGLVNIDDRPADLVRDWGRVPLPWRLFEINTLLLLISSLTMELARRSATRQAALAPVKSIPGVSLGNERNIPWLELTMFLGFGFLAGQWTAWGELHRRGFYLDTNPSSSFAFLLTATHALHLAGGMIGLLWATSASLLDKPPESRRILVDITAWYWHFMAVLWIWILALMGLAK